MVQTRLTPNFYIKFQCVGEKCENNCCQGWTVGIDKATYKRYLAHAEPLIRETARQNISLSKKSHSQWGVIKLTESGLCPFLDGCGLCQIHKLAGTELLSQTCQGYPRIHQQFGQQHSRSLTLSCPEACRLVLLDPEAMQFQAEPWRGPQSGKPLPGWAEQLHLYAMQIMLQAGLTAEERLFLTGMLVQKAEELVTTQATDPAQALEAFFATLCQLVESGQWQPLFAQVPGVGRVQWNALRNLTHLIWGSSQTETARGSLWLQAMHTKLSEQMSGEYAEAKLERMHQAWQQQVLPWLAAEQPQLLDNYFCYSLYHDHFPCASLSQPTQPLRLLVADYFLLRSYMSQLALEGELTTQAVVALFHHYHTRRQHNPGFMTALASCLQGCDLDQDLALYALLKSPAPANITG